MAHRKHNPIIVPFSRVGDCFEAIFTARIIGIDPDVVVIMITAHGSVDTAVEAMKRGATDFVTKPWQNEKVVATVSTGVELRRSRSEAATLKRANEALRAASGAIAPDIVSTSAAMVARARWRFSAELIFAAPLMRR